MSGNSVGIPVAFILGMKSSSGYKMEILYIAGIVAAVTCGHYLISAHFSIAHNILQRAYYIPILWAAYRFGKRGGLWVSIITSFLYLPHILITWQMHPEYQVNQVLEIILFIVIGTAAGILFERKADDQTLLQSYEKLAFLGILSRSVIRSLKTPLKSLDGMLMTLEPMASHDPAIESCVGVMKSQLDAIAKVRNDLISLVERKKLRLKKQRLDEIAASFASEIELGLRLREIRLIKQMAAHDITAQINNTSIHEALHHLVGIMVDNLTPTTEMTIYTGQSSAHVWLGVSSRDIRLNSYYLSDLSCLSVDSWGDYNLIDVINTMNNHFGDFRCRWNGSDLIEFIFVFPKRLKLPWYLKDEPATNTKQIPTTSNQLRVVTVPPNNQRPQSSNTR